MPAKNLPTEDSPVDEDATTIYSKGSATDIKGPARKLLEDYSNIPPEEVDVHVLNIRERGFRIRPYPCIAHLRFLALSLSLHPAYPHVLRRLQDGQTFLELGCCFGQEIRKLVYDGALAKNLHGMEMVEDFVKLGYELFVDKESLRSEFLVANIMQPTSVSIYEHIQGDTDIIYASSFFHLFTLEEQFELAMKVVDILRPRAGSMILGRQLGSVRPGIYPLRKLEEGKLYRHDVASFTQMWKDVGDATGTVWSVDAALDEEELGYKGNESWGDPDMRRLRFAVYRQ